MGKHVGKEVDGNIIALTKVMTQRFACSTEEI
jgi:hypothetical protein